MDYIKNCPLCNIPTFKDGGCNYMKCSDGENIKSSCPCEWCWQCYKPKYRILENRPEMGFCDDKTHNSH